MTFYLLVDFLYWIIPLTVLIPAVSVFNAKNPVYGVLSFVFVVLQLTILLVAIDQEFLGFLLAVVYIGAIVVLFLFVTMMFHLRNPSRTLFSLTRGPRINLIYKLGAVFFTFTALGLCVSHQWFLGYLLSEPAPVDYVILAYEVPQNRLLAEFLFSSPYCGVSLLLAMTMLVGILGAVSLALKATHPPTSFVSISSPIPPALRLRIGIESSLVSAK